MRIEDSATTGRITVYGSCVARDAASEMENRGWSVERYIARQSLISAGRPADVGDLDLSYESVDMISDPGLTLTIYAAEPGSPTAQALDLLASWQATELAAATEGTAARG